MVYFSMNLFPMVKCLILVRNDHFISTEERTTVLFLLGMSNREVLAQIESGYRMPRHANCPETVYLCMLRCWDASSDNRPTFEVNEKRIPLNVIICSCFSSIYMSFLMIIPQPLVHNIIVKINRTNFNEMIFIPRIRFLPDKRRMMRESQTEYFRRYIQRALFPGAQSLSLSFYTNVLYAIFTFSFYAILPDIFAFESTKKKAQHENALPIDMFILTNCFFFSHLRKQSELIFYLFCLSFGYIYR